MDAAEAQARLDQILDQAQRQQIVIQQQGKDVAVVLSIESYERLRMGGRSSLSQCSQRGRQRGRGYGID